MKDIQVIEQNSPTPLALIDKAMSNPNFDIEKLERLLSMQERWEANIARKEFFDAMAKFQSVCPTIKRNANGYGGYKYATLGQVISQIQGAMLDCGLSYRWEPSEKETRMGITCIITHKGGHSVTTTMYGPPDKTGSKNEIQAWGSTKTYLERYTLTGALGIGTADQDTDGAKKPEVKLSPDMQIAIDDAKNEEELMLVWNKNSEMKKDTLFVKAMGLRKKQLGIKSKKVEMP